jgi:tetratricopeptide (TPR) repeat protein
MKQIVCRAVYLVALTLFLYAPRAAAQGQQATVPSQAPAPSKAPAQAKSPGKAKDLQPQMKGVLSAYDAGHFDRAMELCKSFLKADPKNLTAHYVMGNICVKTNRIKDAIVQYQYCLQAQGAKTSPEATYSRTALEQIKQQSNGQAAGQAALPSAGGNSGAASGQMVGSSKGAEEYIQEQTEMLMKESREKLAVKQRTLDDKVGQIQEEMRQQAYNLPRVGGRRVAAQEAKQEVSEEIKQDGQRRIEQLKKDFQREADDLNQAYQTRISGLSDHYHNVQSQSAGRSGSR